MLEQPRFGLRLRELRIERGLSQAALAGNELSTGYLSRLESGARPPTPRVVEFLARQLMVPVSAFDAPRAPSLAQVVIDLASSPTPQGVDVLAETIKADNGQDRDLLWQATWLLSDLLAQQGRHEEQAVHLAELLRLSDELDMPSLRVRARTQYARCMRSIGDNDRACRLAREAVRLARAHQLSARDRASALLVLVSAVAEAGHLSDAGAYADELLTLIEGETGTLQVQGLWTAATVRARQGDSAGAMVLLDRALRSLEGKDDVLLWIRLRLVYVSLSLQQESPDLAVARERLAEVEPVLNLLGTALHRQELRALRAHLAGHDGDHERARADAEQVLAESPPLAFRDRVRLRTLLNRILILQGNRSTGISNLEELAREAQETHNIDLASEIWRTLAQTLAASD
jgi:transcriptional regulator with XRE-family HTH domain